MGRNIEHRAGRQESCIPLARASIATDSRLPAEKLVGAGVIFGGIPFES